MELKEMDQRIFLGVNRNRVNAAWCAMKYSTGFLAHFLLDFYGGTILLNVNYNQSAILHSFYLLSVKILV